MLGFSILFGLLWCWLDRHPADRRTPNRPPRRLWPWAEPPMRSVRSAQVQTVGAGAGAATIGTGVTPRTSSTSTNNTTSSGSRTIVGSISSAKPLNPPSPPLRPSRSRDGDEDPRRSDDSLPQYIQVHPPPKAVLVGSDHGRMGQWCAKTVAKIEGSPVTRVKSWEVGDPEKRYPDPFTA